LLYVLRRRLGGLDERAITTALGKIALASLVMGAVAFGTDWLLAWWLPSRAFPVMLLRVGVSIAAGLGVLDLMAHALGIREYLETREALRERLFRGRTRG
jgi:peptidoglycan biosynthesis protein MviN/MurJ (putative lipid II flippase)